MIHYPSTPTDLGNIPYPLKNDVNVFIGGIGTGGSANNWKIWNKPKGSTMTYIVAIGGGGGGGAGVVSGGDKGGGAGGGSGGIARLIIPSIFLPEILYVLAGDGGQGGLASGNAGTAGGISYVTFTPSTALVRSILIQSNAAAAGGGGAGTTTTAAGGAGGTSASPSFFSNLGLQFTDDAGQAGANAPSGAGNNPGNAITAWTNIPLSGGASGGSTTGTNTAGGAITAASAINFTYINWPTTAGAVAAGGAAGTGNGSSGVNLFYPFLTSGGGGGGSNDGAAAGGGGAGGIGSGGGGGGGANNAGGQRGGNGGPGMVIIYSW